MSGDLGGLEGIFAHSRVVGINHAAPSSIQTISDAFSRMTDLCAEFGYDYFLIGHPQETGVTTKNTDIILSNLPLYIVNELVELNLMANWSVTKILHGTSAAFYWPLQFASQILVADHTPIVEDELKFASDADRLLSSELDIRSLHCVPAATLGEARVYLALFYSTSEERELDPAVCFKFQKLFDQIESINRTREANLAAELNGREIECLSWAAAGKTSGEIAKIISLSEHTVNHYLISCCKKLDCMSRTQAVAKAIRSRIIP